MAIEPIIDSVIDIEATDKEEEYVTLSTIHSAKGLEWHSVFIIHAVEGFFPIKPISGKFGYFGRGKKIDVCCFNKSKAKSFYNLSNEYL